MWIAESIEQARRRRGELAGSVALVPTMGMLHRGHLSLLEAARGHGEQVIVSIFVNPAQFGPDEDFEQYPRRLGEDLAACREGGATGVFAPDRSEMYPPDAIESAVTVPSLAVDLEGRFRPGHFEGVCRVVLKLLHIIQPDCAWFGQKDYQQWLLVHRLVGDLNLPVRIERALTVREPEGLALSSRNQYLQGDQRRHALGLVKALREAKMLIEESDETDPQVVEGAMTRTMLAHHVKVDYAVLRHPRSLAPMDCIEPQLAGGVVALVAGHVGQARLIDNMIITGQ